MTGTHSPLAFPLALGVALLAAFVAHELLRQAVGARRRPAWLATGAATLGLGVTSVHFIGMLGYRVREGSEFMPIAFDLPRVLLAAALGTAGAAVAAGLARPGPGRRASRLAAAAVLGAVVLGTHFAAIAAMHVSARLTHDVPGVAAAAATALLAGCAIVFGASRPSPAGGPAVVPAQLLGAAIGAAAIVGTHFTAMTAVRLGAGDEPLRLGARHVLATDGLASMVATATLLVIGLGAAFLLLGRQAGERRVEAERYADLYREADTARVAAEGSERRFRIALDAARELSASLDFDATLRQVTALAVPRLADYCLVYVREPDGAFRQLAAEHADPAKRVLLAELAGLHRPDASDPHGPVARAVATRAPVLAPSAEGEDAPRLPRDPHLGEILRRLAPLSYMVLPLVARGELLGALTLASAESGRRYGAEDLATAELVAARAALAIDNARLYTEARRAGEEAVRAAGLEAQLMRARLEALRAQLNPHFLFNALNTLAMLVRRGANPEALRGIVSLSHLLRHALSDLATLEVPLRAEVGLVEHYLEIEQLRFRDRLRPCLRLAPDTLDARVPSLVLQPLVENAVRHGVARRADAGRVEVASRREGDELVLEVRDDGPGFPPGWDAASSGGIGIANTRERLHRLYGGRAHFEARNADDGAGAVVRLRIPLHPTPAAPAAPGGQP